MAELHSRFGGLPSRDEASGIWSDIWHLEAHHSTALEGNTLVLRQVAALLDQGKTVGAKPLKDYLEVNGYGQAAEWVYGHALEPGDWGAEGLISLHEVRRIHTLAMTPVWDYVADVLIPCEYQHRLPRTRDIAAVRTARNQRLRMGSEPAAHICMGRKVRRSPLFQHELS